MQTLDKVVNNAIDDFIERLSFYGVKKVVLGLSGGLDSIVLLHLLAKRNLPLTAVYINHQLQPEANQWAEFCQQTCQGLNVSFEVQAVTVASNNRQGMESNARNARYKALLACCVQQEACLVTAQHRQDQAETLLMNIGRGTGMAGLVGMPEVKRHQVDLQTVLQFRPLKHISRQSIQVYAEENGLSWIEDPSNENTEIKRNWVRLNLLPIYQNGWPQIEQSLDQLSVLAEENLTLLDALAESDLKPEKMKDFYLSFEQDLDLIRKKNQLRFWAQNHAGFRLNNTILNWFETLFQQDEFEGVPTLKQAGFKLKYYNRCVFYIIDINDKYEFCVSDFNPLKLKFFQHQKLEKWLTSLPADTLLTPVQKGKNINDINYKKLSKWFKENKVPIWDRKRWPVTEGGGGIFEQKNR